MLVKAFEFALLTFGITLAVALFVATIVKVTAMVVRGKAGTVDENSKK